MIGPVMLLAAESATFLDGGDLYSLCNGSKADELQCLRYLEGAADGIAIAQSADPGNARIVCVPTKATVKKLAAVTVKYMKRNPDVRGQQGSVIVWRAFSKAFPCSKGSGDKAAHRRKAP